MIEDIFIRPDFDNSKIIVTFSRPKGCSKIDYRVLDEGEQVAGGTVTGNGDTVRFEETLPDFKPWSVDTPFMYKLNLTVHQNGQADKFEQPFAMTKIHTQDSKIYFNNKPIYLRGYIRGRKGHEHENLTGVSTTEFYEKNIRMARAYGFNFIRFHSVLPPKEFFDAADKLGILCHVEIRNYWGRYQKEREATGFDDDKTLVNELDWETMLCKLRNHPCVLIYCMGNEIDDPGNNERVKIISQLTKKIDPTRLFLDTCSRGEYDRDTVDIDVQHMSYFAPFGEHYDMFDDSIHLSIYGSITGKKMTVQDSKADPTYVMHREVPLKFPLLAHEVCHYVALRDPWELDKKFRKYGAKKPWWIDELIKMTKAKGHEKQYKKMLEASGRFQYIWTKQGLESVRKSALLEGFHYLQLADCDDYENANGILDCFDDAKGIPAEKFLPFNDQTVIVADLPQRSFWGKTKLEIPIFLSHYSTGDFNDGILKWELKSKDGNTVSISAEMDQFDLSKRGHRKLCRLEIDLPEVQKPQWLIFSCELTSADGKHKTANQWDLWLFPNDPSRIGKVSAAVDLTETKLSKRYTQFANGSDVKNPEKLLIIDHIDEKVIKHLAAGNDVLLVYRVAQNHARKAPREKYYLPSTWERFKGIIWDRGHNCGGFLREHPIIEDFPHDGLVDWQFYHLIEDSDKIDLDDFPVKIEPIIEGVDKAIRDRFDVGRFDLSEFQYEYTMRKFAYLFELKVGNGRVIVAGMTFKPVEWDEPATCWMFESIINYMRSNSFEPKASLSVEDFSNYLLEKGKGKQIKERMMTQYWQLDAEPLESKDYWKASEEWLREDD